ncbi:serine/threonine protein phosphatase [Actinomadura craniellae]|uniref:Serine/threonine protein phosphatase n=1 Tax=Actinomadura craniellae TaxID=2231787 RepID=A0A365H035_9ACTN|nr:fused response regulator/phosphatase [Actinomadura craniellae]RAY11563.1 serine/threonine protein phosphatase [Actinomadura craniellae]
MPEHAGVTTLVVDDTATKRYIISSWLRRAGHTVVEAASGAETWERLAEHAVDLVILDVRLPDMSGFEVCEQIKAGPETGSLPVIHISASATAVTDRTHGLRQGADAYITDPIDPGEFIATVDAVLRYYRARRRAEQLAGRMAALARATLAINSATSFDELAAIAAQSAAEIFAVPAGAYIAPPNGPPRRATVLSADDEPVISTLAPDVLARIGAALGMDGDAAGTVSGVVPDARWREFQPDKLTSHDACAVLTRTKPGRPPTCIAVAAGGIPDAEEYTILQQLAQTLALAVQALRNYTEEHTIALTLQRSLLPQGIPDLPGWSVAVRYEPASETAEIGGDFYEMLDLDGRVLVAIGDVQGHSLEAAAVMGELRHALRAFADQGLDATEILRRMNSVMQRYHPHQTATVCLLTLDPATGGTVVASAGHLPVLFLHEGRARWGAGGGILLGFPVDEVALEETEIPPGATAVLFTDGLIEDRGIPIDDNLERLRRLCTETEGDLETFRDRIIAEFGHREDDVALIALRRDA